MIMDTKKEGNLLHKKLIYMISQAKSTPPLCWETSIWETSTNFNLDLSLLF
jgi:hypothetical protein